MGANATSHMGVFQDSEENALSDADSIGSASDLRAREEEEESGGERRKKDDKKDRESETVTMNDSVLTCGSSAYHAECESMARDEVMRQPTGKYILFFHKNCRR